MTTEKKAEKKIKTMTNDSVKLNKLRQESKNFKKCQKDIKI
jgi:hypothetical protein